MVSDWKAPLPCQNYSSRVLEWDVVFYLRATRQRPGRPSAKEGPWRDVENKAIVMSNFVCGVLLRIICPWMNIVINF